MYIVHLRAVLEKIGIARERTLPVAERERAVGGRDVVRQHERVLPVRGRAVRQPLGGDVAHRAAARQDGVDAHHRDERAARGRILFQAAQVAAVRRQTSKRDEVHHAHQKPERPGLHAQNAHKPGRGHKEQQPLQKVHEGASEVVEKIWRLIRRRLHQALAARSGDGVAPQRHFAVLAHEDAAADAERHEAPARRKAEHKVPRLVDDDREVPHDDERDERRAEDQKRLPRARAERVDQRPDGKPDGRAGNNAERDGDEVRRERILFALFLHAFSFTKKRSYQTRNVNTVQILRWLLAFSWKWSSSSFISASVSKNSDAYGAVKYPLTIS